MPIAIFLDKVRISKTKAGIRNRPNIFKEELTLLLFHILYKITAGNRFVKQKIVL